MSCLGNILWFLLGGFLTAMLYFLAGLVMCITIVGIPFGVELMKIGAFALFPFGRDVELARNSGCLSLGFNILWVLFGWWEIALVHLVLAVLCAVTIIGIPFGVKIMKLGALALAPFGKTVHLEPAKGCLSTVFNIIWAVTGWWEIAIVHLVFGILLCITLIGIPLGKQHFKMAQYSLFPFGGTIK